MNKVIKFKIRWDNIILIFKSNFKTALIKHIHNIELCTLIQKYTNNINLCRIKMEKNNELKNIKFYKTC